MRTGTIVAALALVMLVGCKGDSQPKTQAIGGNVELVTLKVPFAESYADTEGAKRVVVTQFKDTRDHPTYVGEGYLAGGTQVARRYRGADDLTWVMPKVLGGYLKKVGFNVTYTDRLGTFDGDVVRDVLDKHQADYVIAGRLEQFDLRVFGTQSRPVLVVVGLRLDVYNKNGRLRTYYPAPLRNAGFLGNRADDPAAVADFVNESIRDVYTRAFENSYFVKTLDLDTATVRELMKAQPAPPDETTPTEMTPDETTSEGTTPAETAPAETNPAEPKPAETKPAETAPAAGLTAEEKAAIERARKARELEDAIKETE